MSRLMKPPERRRRWSTARHSRPVVQPGHRRRYRRDDGRLPVLSPVLRRLSVPKRGYPGCFSRRLSCPRAGPAPRARPRLLRGSFRGREPDRAAGARGDGPQPRSGASALCAGNSPTCRASISWCGGSSSAASSTAPVAAPTTSPCRCSATTCAGGRSLAWGRRATTRPTTATWAVFDALLVDTTSLRLLGDLAGASQLFDASIKLDRRIEDAGMLAVEFVEIHRGNAAPAELLAVLTRAAPPTDDYSR